MIFLNMKICSVRPLPDRKRACSFLNFDPTPVRILSITILPITLLTTDSSVFPCHFLHSFRFPFFSSLTISPFLHLSPHYVYNLFDLSGSIVDVNFKTALLAFCQCPGAFPFSRFPIYFLTSALLGSDVSISSVSSSTSISISVIWIARVHSI